MWYRLLCAGKVTAFCGSATKPCGPCFVPQGSTKRLVASASPSGWHVHCRAAGCGCEGTTDHKKLEGAQSTGFCCSLLVYFWRLVSGKQRHIYDQLRAPFKGCGPRPCRTKVSSDTKPRRKKSCSGRRVPSVLPFQGCDRSPVLQVLRAPDRHHGRAGSCPAHPRGSMREPQRALQRPHSSSQTGSIRSLARSAQISRASPARRLLWSAFQSL